MCLLNINDSSAQTTETLDAGSYIVDMGILPQTIENAIVPYGMVYDLLDNYGADIKWVINTTKAKDGTDFTYNGYDYKGGPFIIPAEYMSAAVLDRIQNYWEPNGVVGTITTSPITVPVYTTIKDMPVWTLDAKNGGIAQGYLDNALIPPTQYNYEDPQFLDCCDDLFAMPHADPEWDTHSNLYDWNLNCSGEIWMACHAGSAFLNMFNYDAGGDPDEQTNFLLSKTGTAMGGGPWADPANAALLWGDHDKGTPPYSYNYPSNPAMQFMGIIDGATQNGSEQIYLPVNGASWNPGAVMV
ncbi:MAG: hypothetical protein KJO29_06480, partial [Bacteroidia bacterium]|nr:hypothetical protein [Bacteroidia bacterium]